MKHQCKINSSKSLVLREECPLPEKNWHAGKALKSTFMLSSSEFREKLHFKGNFVLKVRCVRLLETFMINSIGSTKQLI
jgi:hypothetical protein